MNNNDSLFLLAGLVALAVGVLITVEAVKEPPELPQEVKRNVALKTCFPEGRYKAAADYCESFRTQIMDEMTMRERHIAQKCLEDNVDINKCVRMK